VAARCSSPRSTAEDFHLIARRRYDGAVLGNVGRRLVEGVVSLFALLGFIYVPLGQHTGFEHARAVLSTPAASAAIEDLTTTALRLRGQALSFLTGHTPAAPLIEGTPNRTGDTSGPQKGNAPRPVPPKLK
jgi:hypothetical protein